MVPEWRNKYLDYHDLDSILNKAIENKDFKADQKGVDLYFELIKFNQKFANFFSRECQAQLDKINSFHKDMLNELQGKFNNLHDQLDQVLSSAIYREIQPNLVHSGTDASNYESNTTINSISDLFRHLRGSSRRAGNDGSSTPPLQDTPTITTTGATDGTSASEATPTSGAGLRPPKSPTTSTRRLSLTPMFSETAAALRRSSNSNLRVCKENMSVMARKLSGTFTHSAQKFSTNLTNFQNAFTYQDSNGCQNEINNQPHGREFNPSAVLTARQRRLRMAEMERAAEEDGHRSEKSDEHRFDFLNFQTLFSSTSQSRRQIVASYKKKLSNLKFAFRELYFNLVLFEQYTQLNHNGFQQILRKHDRMFASSLGRKFYEEHVQTADFYNDLQAIDHLIESVEHIYTLHFENGNRRRAIEKLQVPTCVYKPRSAKLDFRVGYELGIFTVLSLTVLIVGLLSQTGYDWRTVFRLYRSPLMLTIFLFQAGISIVIWKHYKINHVLIFELDPRNNLSFHHFIEFGSLLGIIWSISVLLFLFSTKIGIKPSVCPLVVISLIALYIFNPTRTCYHQARFWLLKRLVSFDSQRLRLIG